MNRVQSTAVEPYSMTRGTSAGNRNQQPAQSTARTVFRQDSYEVTISSQEQQRQQAIQDIMGQIQSAYSGVDITFLSLDDPAAIANYAAAFHGGKHLAIDPDFVSWMSEGSQAFQQGMDFLNQVVQQLSANPSWLYPGKTMGTGAVIGENGEVTYWAAVSSGQEEKGDGQKDPLEDMLAQLDSIQKWQEQQAEQRKEAQKNKNTLVIKKKIGYTPGRDMARLAKISTSQDVRALISKVYARSVAIKGNSNYDKEEVRMTVSQMESVIMRARSKIKHLKEESQLEVSRKKAVEQQKQEQALQIAIQLRKQRTARRSREHAQIFEKFPYIPQSILNPRRMDGQLDPDEDPLNPFASMGLGESIPVPIVAAAALPANGTETTIVMQAGQAMAGGTGTSGGGTGAAAAPISLNIVV